MFLKRFVFVNWGNIPNIEFDLGPVNLLSGGNGSGKTTAADAIQTIMTAAHENLFQYNPGQDETTQRGRGGKRVRTLASYVLGCDDGSYARPNDSTDGYLAAVFHPTQGETADPFTAIIGVRAWLDQSGGNTVARQEDALFFILPGEQLTLKQFVREDKAGKYVAPLDQLQTLLISEFGKKAVEKYDTKRAYLRRLYGALRGMRDAVAEQEAMAAARAFSRFMAYKPVQSINKFVAEEILERKDLGEAIRSISSQLKTIHAMERDASKLKESITVLEQARQQSQRYIEQWLDLNTLDYTLAQHTYQQRQQEYLAAKKQQDDLRRNLKESEAELALSRQRSEQVHEQLVTLEAQRIGVPALQQKDELEQKLRKEEALLGEQARQLLIEDNRLQQNIQLSSQIKSDLLAADLVEELPQVTDLKAASLCRQVLDQGKRIEINYQTMMQRDMTNDLAALEHHLDKAREIQQVHNQWHEHWHNAELQGGVSLRDQLTKLYHGRERSYSDLDDQYKTKRREIERLEAHQVSYPGYVERAIAEIKRHCPQADPRVLCDHIEVKDAQWQAAIEGYLGGARFSIIVEPAYEAEAIRIVRRMPGRDNKARIIQGEKARQDAERMSAESDSIIHVLEFSHAVARYYVMASYGTVQRVKGADQLRHTRRGLTADGMASGNYSMWRCDLPDSELVFGVAARERALRAKLQEFENIQVRRNSASEKLQRCGALLKAVNGVVALEYADVITTLLATRRELQTLEALLAQLDLTEFEALEERLKQLREDEKRWRNQEHELLKQIGQSTEKLNETDKRCHELSEKQEKNREAVDGWEETLRTIAAVWPGFDVDARLDHADSEARDLNLEFAMQQRKEIERQLHASERQMGEKLQTHNQQCRPGDAIIYQGFSGNYDSSLFKTICGLQLDIDRVYNILKNNILVEKHGQLVQLKDSFNNAFVTNLCHSIHQAINDGKRQIELLNRELQHHRFGADRETFRFDSEWIPEYRDYARFFEEVVKLPMEDVSLFDAELSAKSKSVRDQLMTMLLAEDEIRAFADLERIADYRNYRHYEIYKEVEGKAPIALSEYGTGSGGQLETPAYIIRSAAITSAFRFAEGSNHLRMVLVDEAFSKMDETRSREVIHYLTNSLGLQLLFIMPTSKCGPFMDLISNEFIFAKCPSDKPRGQLMTRVFVDRKRCNEEKIKTLWASHRRMIYQQAELDFMDLV